MKQTLHVSVWKPLPKYWIVFLDTGPFVGEVVEVKSRHGEENRLVAVKGLLHESIAIAAVEQLRYMWMGQNEIKEVTVEVDLP
jgi:hypothetical protein